MPAENLLQTSETQDTLAKIFSQNRGSGNCRMVFPCVTRPALYNFDGTYMT